MIIYHTPFDKNIIFNNFVMESKEQTILMVLRWLNHQKW